jgi:hypothetical protein
LAVKHLATLRKQEEISTAHKKNKQISKNFIAIVHNEGGNANDKSIHPFWCFLSGTVRVNFLFDYVLFNDALDISDNTASKVWIVNK